MVDPTPAIPVAYPVTLVHDQSSPQGDPNPADDRSLRVTVTAPAAYDTPVEDVAPWPAPAAAGVAIRSGAAETAGAATVGPAMGVERPKKDPTN